ncbi:MAG: DUF1294 domain-containing protein [Oscillospiraceae bacterium]|nr:DUF1294 domain-containing protein [Oscillospiraceae bacterium]
MGLAEKLLLIWGLGINLLTFILFGLDKHRAKQHRWRISEASLLGLSLLGGSVGALLGMRLFHHKTRHPIFVWGIPLFFVGHLALLILLLR